MSAGVSQSSQQENLVAVLCRVADDLPVIRATTWTFTMGEVVFELLYTCAVTGEQVQREVSGFERARKLAKELAKASCRRAIIRRKRIWRMLLVDLQTQTYYPVEESLGTSDAAHWWQSWDSEGKRAVALPWPESLPMPKAFEAA